MAQNDLIPPDEIDLDGNGNSTEATPRDLLLQVRRADDPNITGTGAPSGSCSLVDMGAYEVVGTSADCNTNGISDTCDITDGIEQDCDQDGMVDDCTPEEELAALLTSAPVCGESWWRSANNISRQTFSCDVTTPNAGQVEIREMMAGHLMGPDLSGNFTFSIENTATGKPRRLLLKETTADLVHRKWYVIRNVGGWAGVEPFDVQYVVQIGDANKSNYVTAADVSLINVDIPCTNTTTCADRRTDINGDNLVLAADASLANSYIPSPTVHLPSGWNPCPMEP